MAESERDDRHGKANGLRKGEVAKGPKQSPLGCQKSAEDDQQ
jgi:hypothetical protein